MNDTQKLMAFAIWVEDNYYYEDSENGGYIPNIENHGPRDLSQLIPIYLRENDK